MNIILVTGGTGFVGSNLCSRLVLDSNNYVICLDNLYSSSVSNISHLLSADNFKFVQHDVINPYIAKVNEIYHLACPASPTHYQRDPIYTTKTSVIGSLNMLELAKQCNAKILLTSTSEIYGDPLVHPQIESYWGNVNTTGIRSCYDEGKRCAESLFADYHRVYDVDTKIVRLFNTYGPGMAPDDGRVVSNFIVQSLQKQNLTIYGDGSQTRSFQYVDDLTNGLILMMASTESGPINIGNPGEFTIGELANKIIELTGAAVSIINAPLPLDDPKQRKPDITLAKNKLNWQPHVQLTQGLAYTVSYFERLLQL
jgi:UDP-glucuronate decarboxylase